jgi:hypothetical protein
VIAAGRTGNAQLPELPLFGQYYGAGVWGHASANTSMQGASEVGTSMFFYAERTGTVDKIRFERRTGPDYSSGDGGLYEIEIRSADPNTRRPLLGVTPVCKINSYAPGNPGDFGSPIELPFDTTGPLVAKQPYCLLFRNIHANPNANYFSSNIVYTYAHEELNGDPDPTPPPVLNDGNPRNAWSPVLIDGTITWYPWPCVRRNDALTYRRVGPNVMEFRYTDGQWTGENCVGSGGSSNPAYRAPISGSNQVRARFRVTRATRFVNGVYLCLPRLQGTTGNLLVTLESGPASDTSGNGTQIEQVSVPHTGIFNIGGTIEKYNEVDSGHPGERVPWFFVPFTQIRPLNLGQFYTLRLSVTGGLSCYLWCTSRADRVSSYSGPSGTDVDQDTWEAQRQVPWALWEDCRAFQISSNGGSTWSTFVASIGPMLFRCF